MRFSHPKNFFETLVWLYLEDMNEDALHNQRLGNKGEALAAEFLVSKGYKILERNFRAGHQEIDIIAQHEEIIHFVEVKTRQDAQFGLGEDAMHTHKITRLLQAIDHYLANSEPEPEWQLDLIVVELRGKSAPQFILYESLGINDAH